MKKEIQIYVNSVAFIFVLFIVIAIGAIAFFTKNFFQYQDEIESVEAKEIKGLLVTLKDENRGSYYIEVKSLKETFKIQSLPIAWEIKKYNIQVGDSVAKEANSKVMIFYKLKNGVYVKCCVYEI